MNIAFEQVFRYKMKIKSGKQEIAYYYESELLLASILKNLCKIKSITKILSFSSISILSLAVSAHFPE